jgi:hypothetical protein
VGNVRRDDEVVLVDFEEAQWRHVAWDVAYLSVPWRSCRTSLMSRRRISGNVDAIMSCSPTPDPLICCGTPVKGEVGHSCRLSLGGFVARWPAAGGQGGAPYWTNDLDPGQDRRTLGVAGSKADAGQVIGHHPTGGWHRGVWRSGCVESGVRAPSLISVREPPWCLVRRHDDRWGDPLVGCGRSIF